MLDFFKNYKKYSDESLIPLILKGNEKAFNEIYRRYHQKMYQYMYRMLNRDEERTNDLLQDLFIKIIEKGDKFDTNRKFSTWLYTVAGNMCRSEYRKIERQTEHQSKINYTQTTAYEDEVTNNFYLPNAIDRSLFEEYLEKALDDLEDIHKQCFILRYQEELSIKEISEILDCPEGTVKSRLFYTLKKISAKLQVFQPKDRKKKIRYEKHG